MENGLINILTTVPVTPNLTPEEAIAVVRKDLETRKFNYNVEKGFWPVFQGALELRDGSMRPTWSVALETPARQVNLRGNTVYVSPKDYFGVVDDETGKLLYFIYSTGYLEPIKAK